MTSRSQTEEILQFLNQEPNFERFIRGNLVELSHITVNIAGLVVFLYSQSILSSDEVDMILSRSSSFEKSMQLYECVLRRYAYRELLEALEASGNEHVLQILWSKIKSSKVPGSSHDEETGSQSPQGSISAPVPIPIPIPAPAPAPAFNRDFVIIKDNIGRGAFGLVISARPTHNENSGASVQNPCAIKILPLLNGSDEKESEREVTLLEDLKGANDLRSKFIVRIERHWRHWKEPGPGASVDIAKEFLRKNLDTIDLRLGSEELGRLRGLLFIQMELCAHGNLHAWVEDNNIKGKQPPEQLQQCRRWFGQVVKGVSFLHSLQIWHRDLKLSNILLADEEDPVEVRKGNKIIAKIADFGQSRYCPTAGENLTINRGTHFYASPELLGTTRIYSEKTDIYSLGVVLVNLLRPIKDEKSHTLENYYVFLNGDPRHVLPDEFTKDFPKESEMATLMLNENPAERPSAQDLLDWCDEHQFI